MVWSFFLKSLGVLALRYQRHDQEYKFPFNIRLGKVEIPIGLGVTTAILGFVAIANLFSKEYATKYMVWVSRWSCSSSLPSRKRLMPGTALLQHIEPRNRSKSSTWNINPRSPLPLHARPGCCILWSPFAITTTWSIFGRCCRKPICAAS